MAKFVDVCFHGEDGKVINRRANFPTNKIVATSGKEYSLGKYIHKGSNGTLFECYDPNGAHVAVKFLHQLDERRKTRFEFESQILSDLNHGNVLRFLDTGMVETTHEEPVPFAVCDRYSGNIEGRIEHSGAYSGADVKRIALQLAAAIGYIHGNGVIHRDIKPANVLISGERIALADFGIAKTTTDEGAARFYKADVTLHSEFVGPVLWLSPELAAYFKDKSTPVDERSDLFQLGLLIWYMLTKEIARGLVSAGDDPTGGRFYDLVIQLLQQKPERRLQTAAQVEEALGAIVL